MDNLVPVVALLSVFGLGMSFALLGSISVKLMPRLKIDQGGFGTLISGFMFTCLIASLVVGVAIDKVGYQIIAIIGFVALGLAILIIARMATFGSTMAACILLGIAAMCVNTAGNTLGPMVILFDGKIDAGRASNFLNVFFGLGLFLFPLACSFLFRATSYENALSVIGLVAFIPAIIAGVAKGYPETPPAFTLGEVFGLIAHPAVIVSALALFCYIALEASWTNWIAPFGKEVISQENPDMESEKVDASAQQMMSAFAIAMMVGRFAASRVPGLTASGGFVIAGMAVLAIVVILGMTASRGVGMAWLLAILAGLACAPCFPTIVGVTFSKYDPSFYGRVFGLIFAVGLAGAVIVPKIMGNMSKGSSIRGSMKVLLPLAVVLVALAIGLQYVKGPKPGQPGAPAGSPDAPTSPTATLVVPAPPADAITWLR